MKATYYFIICGLVMLGCSGERQPNTPEDHDHITGQADQQYTCPMHPQVVSKVPGSCPICGMDLVQVETAGRQTSDLMLTESQVRLANITVERVTRKSIGQTVPINGQLKADEAERQVISSRASGRVERLYIKETGPEVKKGQPLYVLYSEQLLTLQQEYLLAKEQYESLGQTEERYRSFLDAAQQKLLLYGLTSGQIARLSSETVEPRITFRAPSSGIVSEIKVAEGQYVEEGTPLYTLDNFNTLWVEAELYPKEATHVKVGDELTVNISGSGNQPVKGKVTFISPEFRNNTQISVVRASVDNRDGNLKPGQFAQVYFTQAARQAIAVPVDAVIRDGHGTHVYVQSGRNTFRPQEVKTGIENFQQVEIREGLEEGDTVAASGAYLLYSEFVLKRGTNPLAEGTVDDRP